MIKQADARATENELRPHRMSHAGMKDAREKKTTRLNINPKPAETINQSLKGVQGVAFEHQDSKNSGSDHRLAEAMQDTQQLLLDAWGGAMHPRTY